MGIDKKGFENAPQPFRTHSTSTQIILKHPPEKLGCTPCHEGQGPAVNSVRLAHGNDPRLGSSAAQGRRDAVAMHQVPYRRGSLRSKDGKQIAINWVDGERMFQQMGCTGCHLVAGYEDMPKIGPYLKLASAKLDPSWTVRWITDPHMFRPHTRMPNFMFSTDQATAARGVYPGQLEQELDGLDDGASGAADARGGHQESRVRRGRQGAVRVGGMQGLPRDRAGPVRHAGRRRRELQAERGAHGQGLRAQPGQDRREDVGLDGFTRGSRIRATSHRIPRCRRCACPTMKPRR